MPKCAYCNSTIILGGVSDGDLRFCNKKCHQDGALLLVSKLVPLEDVTKRVTELHRGSCPKCGQTGPVDVHTAHSIWSALVVTSWKSSPQISCTPCGKKAKIKATVGSFFLGWWGFPWGLLGTPVQITKNLWGLAQSPSPFAPSPQLEKVVRLSIAAELQQAQRAVAAPPALKAN